MITERQKRRIAEVVNHSYILTRGSIMTEREEEDYFLMEYQEPKTIDVDDDFFTYKECESYIWIQDFVSDNVRNSYKLLNKIKEMAKTKHIECQVNITNIKILNIIIRQGFRIIDLKGYNYLLQYS